jgi:hypothetical protein
MLRGRRIEQLGWFVLCCFLFFSSFLLFLFFFYITFVVDIQEGHGFMGFHDV